MDKIISCKWMGTAVTSKSRMHCHRAATCMPAVRHKATLGIAKTQHTINYGLLKQRNVTEGKQRLYSIQDENVNYSFSFNYS